MQTQPGEEVPQRKRKRRRGAQRPRYGRVVEFMLACLFLLISGCVSLHSFCCWCWCFTFLLCSFSSSSSRSCSAHGFANSPLLFFFPSNLAQAQPHSNYTPLLSQPPHFYTLALPLFPPPSPLLLSFLFPEHVFANGLSLPFIN